MATSLCKSAIFIGAFLYLALLLPSVIGLRIMEEGLCEKPSGTWKGVCFRSDHCNQQCMEKEGALGGTCSGLECWCRHKYCGTTCEKPSGIWKGPCFRTSHCKQQCRQKENAVRGYCNLFLECQCVVDC